MDALPSKEGLQIYQNWARLKSDKGLAPVIRRLYGYNEVREILERGDDVDFMPSDDEHPESAPGHLPQTHRNIRGREYYSNLSLNNKKDNDNGKRQ